MVFFLLAPSPFSVSCQGSVRRALICILTGRPGSWHDVSGGFSTGLFGCDYVFRCTLAIARPISHRSDHAWRRGWRSHMRLAVTVHTINSYLTQITSPRIAIGYQAGLVLKFHPASRVFSIHLLGMSHESSALPALNWSQKTANEPGFRISASIHTQDRARYQLSGSYCRNWDNS